MQSCKSGRNPPPPPPPSDASPNPHDFRHDTTCFGQWIIVHDFFIHPGYFGILFISCDITEGLDIWNAMEPTTIEYGP